MHTAHSVGHISNGYRPYAVRPCVSHWTSIPYEAILCQNPGRNLPERRHTVALRALCKCLWLCDLPRIFGSLWYNRLIARYNYPSNPVIQSSFTFRIVLTDVPVRAAMFLSEIPFFSRPISF